MTFFGAFCNWRIFPFEELLTSSENRTQEAVHFARDTAEIPLDRTSVNLLLHT